MLEQIISLAGAVLILVAFAAQQLEKIKQDSVLYLSLNLVGAVILAIVAYRIRQLGLTLLEGAWAGISLYSLVRISALKVRGD